jgi:maltooligosyltrehalose trehalohydrolase
MTLSSTHHAVTTFEVWAPLAARMRLRVGDDTLSMTKGAQGWWSIEASAPAGTDYGYLLDDSDDVLPDPRTQWQPRGVHGPSRVYDHDAFVWSDDGWAGRDLPGAVIYELQIATFTAGGTFDAAIARLDHLVALGVTHVEVLPVNAVNGTWDWGYDGVDWYAVHQPIGGPDGFKRFIDACHARGLAVLLDVVYNHLGPSGNYLPKFGPYLTEGESAWGDLINLAEPPVRRFILDNAVMWLRDYHLDGLRLDAVHALVDHSTPHLLAELSAEVETLSARLGRPLPLIAESDLNDAVMIEPRAEGGYGLTAQWDDDVHHALHAMLTGERQGYYVDFGSLAVFAKVVQAAFLHDGTYSTFREKVHGRPVDRERIPGYRFVVCLQNHDQVGNRAQGERLTELASPELLRVGAVLLFSLPFTPMLWMGEEWAASTRWPYFTSHPEPELARQVSDGRVEEFADFGWDTDEMLDPQDPAAYVSAKLDWNEVDEPEGARMLDLYTRLIALRASEPELANSDLTAVTVDYDEKERWLILNRENLRIVVNLADATQHVSLPEAEPSSDWRLLLTTDDETKLLGTKLLGTSVALPARSAAIVRAR